MAILLLLLGLVPLAVYGQTTPPAEDEGSLIENLLALPVNGLYKALQVLGLKTFDELIFNNSYGELAPYTPDRKFSFLNSLESIIYAFAIVLFMPYIVRLIFQFNNGLVSLFKGIAGSMGVIGGNSTWMRLKQAAFWLRSSSSWVIWVCWSTSIFFT